MDFFQILLYVILIYITVSVICFCFPQLIHTIDKPINDQKCSVIVHRGGCGEALEGTLEAFKQSVEAGADQYELDVLMTSDGQIVVSHDDDLKRLTGVDVKISETKYEDLPPVKTELDVLFYDGQTYKHDGPPGRIALLKDVFEVLKGAPAVVELKNGCDEMIDKVHDMIREYNLEDKVIWATFDEVTNEKLYTKNPKIQHLFATNGVLKLYLLFVTGLLPFFTLRESVFAMILPSIIPSRYTQRGEYLKYAKYMGILQFLTMRKCLFNHLRKRGIRTYLWVLDDEKHFEEAYNLGVDGIMTDYPVKLINWMKTKHQKSS